MGEGKICFSHFSYSRIYIIILLLLLLLLLIFTTHCLFISIFNVSFQSPPYDKFSYSGIQNHSFLGNITEVSNSSSNSDELHTSLSLESNISLNQKSRSLSKDDEDEQQQQLNDLYFEFPSSIPKIKVRSDIYTNQPVSRGQLQKLGGPFTSPYSLPLNDQRKDKKKVTFHEFRRILQCSPHEPALDGNRGSLSLLRMLPPTRKTIELICVWALSGCTPWSECHKIIESRLSIKMRPPIYYGFEPVTGSPYQVRLIRIINGSLYYDWPWNRKHFDKLIIPDQYFFIQEILNKISDIGDSLFLKGEEKPFLPHEIPFPAFSESTTLQHMDMLMPWRRSIIDEYIMYNYSILKPYPKSLYIYGKHNHPNDWKNRIPKAAFFGSVTSARSIIFDAAVLRPDLIVAQSNFEYTFMSTVNPWNPLNKVSNMTDEMAWNHQQREDYMSTFPNETELGTYQSIFKGFHPKFQDIFEVKYKYLIVLVGSNGKAPADRLAQYIAHSGAVILLQTTSFEYHFSPYLKPWVHYVPITHNIVDIIAKVSWLSKHDHAAFQLAENAKRFGESYLRLEDYYCYMGTALYALGKILNGSDALQPFNPKLIENIPSNI